MMTLDATDNGLSGGTISTDSFINSLGVSTHLPYTDGGYANISNVAADLAYLGLSNVRDTITNGQYGSAYLSTFTSLAQEGVKFTFLVTVGGAVTTASLNATLNLIDQVNEAKPGSVVAVEGANEINNYPISFNGETDDLTAAIELQQTIYADVHSDPNLSGVSVDYFTGYNAYSLSENQPIAPGPDPSQTTGLADFDVQHPYPATGTPPAATIAPSYALRNESSASGYGPAVYTETGYSTNPAAGGANQDIQAKYTLDLLFDAAVDGISRTYLYQLLDPYAPDAPQGDDGYGLFDSNNAPKEAATAIHNLTTILSDPGAPAGVTPTRLAYSVTNLPTTGNSIALEKSTGAYDIVVYNEPEIWNLQTQMETTAPTQTVMVELGGTFDTVEVFDPLVSMVPQSILHNVSSVELGLTDHPLIVEIEAPCYCRGTRILTDHGEVAVEALQVGDHVITTIGTAEPIRWIGHRRYAGRFIAGNHLMLPVTIRADAMADGVPECDLSVSPGHGMYVDGQIVPAWRLINGVSITQAEAVEEVQYFHVELERHAMLFANGAAAESFLDVDGFRGRFHNATDVYACFPEVVPLAPMQARLEDGFALQQIQDRLSARAGIAPQIEPAGILRGFVDQATSERICGWAQDADSPEEPVTLEVMVGGQPVLCVLANTYRADLRRAGIGSGCHAFDVALPAGLQGRATVCRVGDSASLRMTDISVMLEQLQAA